MAESYEGLWGFEDENKIYQLSILRSSYNYFHVLVSIINDLGESELSESYRTQIHYMGSDKRFLWLLDIPKYGVELLDENSLEFRENIVPGTYGDCKWKIQLKRK